MTAQSYLVIKADRLAEELFLNGDINETERDNYNKWLEVISNETLIEVELGYSDAEMEELLNLHKAKSGPKTVRMIEIFNATIRCLQENFPSEASVIIDWSEYETYVEEPEVIYFRIDAHTPFGRTNSYYYRCTDTAELKKFCDECVFDHALEWCDEDFHLMEKYDMTPEEYFAASSYSLVPVSDTEFKLSLIDTGVANED